jgi:hypothetical protein
LTGLAPGEKREISHFVEDLFDAAPGALEAACDALGVLVRAKQGGEDFDAQ